MKRQAGQDIKRRISRVFIARSDQDKSRILAYYSLSTLSIDLSILPEQFARKLPKHPIPAALIGRLAVDTSAQSQGIGNMLLSNAIQRALAVSHDIAIYAIVVDAIDAKAERSYMQSGFARLTSDGKRKRLFLPLRAI
ncbi:MAG: GNAT family N-acetyltransferase [Halioglobus sp.]|nr:GNAT family N-acetyltransferase [Halioglobus sp.]